MLFVTSDTHGDYSRFTQENFPEQALMTKEDYVIICGDFGIWDTTPMREARLDELNNRPFTTLFVDGNHENYDLLSLYSIEEWHGGLVHRVKSSILTHCAPTGIGTLVVGVGDYHPDRLTEFHQTVYDNATFDCWFCGHYHTEKRVYKNFATLYHQISVSRGSDSPPDCHSLPPPCAPSIFIK